MLIVPERLSLEDLESIYRGATASLDPECRNAVDRSAAVIAKTARGDAAVYGVNTGFGKLASVRIPAEDTERLQKNLILSHCAGVGDPLDEAAVRLVVALKMVSLGRGASGVRWEIVEMLSNMLAKGVIPRIPGKGSVGASGDLAPLAHLAATMIGENPAWFEERLLSGRDALRRAGLEPVVLAAKEGLALINGTQVSTALALAGLFDAWRNAVTSIVTGALSTDAAMGSSSPFQAEIHELRGHRRQIDVARVLRNLLTGSEIRESHRLGDERVQDPYCLRCQPQVLGAVLTALCQAASVLRVEAAAVTDNPLVLENGAIVSGGNFHGETVGFAADQIAMAIAEAGSIVQRRIALLVDPALSFGLPGFLAREPGLNSGFMAAEIVSAALSAENKALANPRVVDSTPTSANQEDHVAMSCHAARRLAEMNWNLSSLIGIEALCAVQGIEFRSPLSSSPALNGYVSEVRRVSPPLVQDRHLSRDLEAAAELVRSGALMPRNAPVLEE